MQLQTDCVCPVVCIFRPEQMLVYHVCCDVIAPLFVSSVDPQSPSKTSKEVRRKGEQGGETTGVGEKGVDIRVTQERQKKRKEKKGVEFF